MFSLFNLIAPVFALVMILQAYSMFNRGKKTWRELLAWTLVWGAFGYIGGWPSVVDRFAGFLGVKSGLNVLIFTSLVILFYIVFQLMVTCEQLEMRITQVVREAALKDAACSKKLSK